MGMRKDRRKKILMAWMMMFFLTATVVYLFFIFKALGDFRTRSYFYSDLSPTSRALIPVLKYLGLIDTEVVSNPKGISKEDIEKTDAIFQMSKDGKEGENGVIGNSVSQDFKGNNTSSSSAIFKPANKLPMNNNLSLPDGGNTSSSFSTLSKEFSSSGSKANIAVAKSVSEKKTENVSSKNLISRLNTTRQLLTEAMKAKSGDAGRMEWERAFSSSIKPDNKMFYKNNAVELDRMKASVIDLKTEDPKGLKAPEVGEPKMEKDNGSQDKAKEVLNSLAKDMASSMINAIGNGLTQGAGGIGREEGGDGADKNASQIPKQIEEEINKWKFEDNEKVQTTFFSCSEIDCKSMGVKGDGVYKAYFPDGFVLSLDQNGKPLNYYYCVSSFNEAEFIKNYQKYALGQN